MLGWDIAADDVGRVESLWVPLVPLCYIVALRCVSHFYNRDGGGGGLVATEAMEVELNHQESLSMSQNPLQG